MKVAIPVETEEGLKSARAEHFGEAPHFIVAEVVDDRLVSGGLYDSVSHEEFGCAGIAEYVASALEADAVVVRQISHDAFAWLHNNGIDVQQELYQEDAAGALRYFIWKQTSTVTEGMCAEDGHHHH